MFNSPSHRSAVMVDNHESQVPTVALMLGIVAYTRMVESLAVLAIHSNSLGGLLHGSNGKPAPGVCQTVWDEMPRLMLKQRDDRVSPGYIREIPAQWPAPDEHEVSRMMWPLDQLREYAKFRNRMIHEHLVGDDVHTLALVYGALHVMHEYRCEDVRRVIMERGPIMGSATPWHTENWKEDVQVWPVRWHFMPMTWTPLFNEVEGNGYYAGALREWERKQKEKTA